MELLSLDEFKQLYRKTTKNFLKFISELYKKDQMYAQSFVKWLATYINYHITKEIFNPAFLPSYKQGQIIFVDLGHRVGYEFGMPHYAIVLDADNRKKSQTLTIVPLTSKKAKHETRTFPWEHELTVSVRDLLIAKFMDKIDIYANPGLREERERLIELVHSAPDKETFEKNYNKILISCIHKIVMDHKEVILLIQHMKQGSIVDISQITTISKQRIITPKKKLDPLYDIRINDNDLSIIKHKLNQHLSIS